MSVTDDAVLHAELDAIRKEIAEMPLQDSALVYGMAAELKKWVLKHPLGVVAFALVGAELQFEMDSE